MRLTGERPARRPARKASTPVPMAVTIPMPVIQTRRRPLMSRYSPAAATSDRRASARALKVASVRPAIGRVNRRSTNAANPGSRGRNTCSMTTCVPVVVGFDPPGHIHAPGRAGHVDEAKPPGGRFRPRPRAPRHRQPKPEDADERPARDEVRDDAAVRPPFDRRRPAVVREEVGPSLDVVREREHELGRGRDADGDLAVHRSFASPGRSARPFGAHEVQRVPSQFAESELARLARREPPTGVGRTLWLVAQLASDDPDPVQDADRVQPVAIVDRRGIRDR